MSDSQATHASSPTAGSPAPAEDLKIFLGRVNGQTKSSRGNQLYRNTIKANREKYQDAIGRGLKTEIINDCIRCLKSYGATFHVKSGPTWVVAPQDKVLSTVKQALREKSRTSREKKPPTAVQPVARFAQGQAPQIPSLPRQRQPQCEAKAVVGVMMDNKLTEAIVWNIEQYAVGLSPGTGCDNTGDNAKSNITSLGDYDFYDSFKTPLIVEQDLFTQPHPAICGPNLIQMNSKENSIYGSNKETKCNPSTSADVANHMNNDETCLLPNNKAVEAPNTLDEASLHQEIGDILGESNSLTFNNEQPKFSLHNKNSGNFDSRTDTTQNRSASLPSPNECALSTMERYQPERFSLPGRTQPLHKPLKETTHSTSEKMEQMQPSLHEALPSNDLLSSKISDVFNDLDCLSNQPSKDDNNINNDNDNNDNGHENSHDVILRDAIREYGDKFDLIKDASIITIQMNGDELDQLQQGGNHNNSGIDGDDNKKEEEDEIFASNALLKASEPSVLMKDLSMKSRVSFSSTYRTNDTDVVGADLEKETEKRLETLMLPAAPPLGSLKNSTPMRTGDSILDVDASMKSIINLFKESTDLNDQKKSNV